MALGAILALAMGLVLGLLGGGGSILSVPILAYVFGLAPKSAIATSLLVVGTTSLTALVGHARRGNVLWTKGFTFGGFAMVGAFGGGRIASYVPGWALLVLFAGMMIATAVAMLRGADETNDAPSRPVPSHALWKVALEGLLVGAFTGLVGAGGGFLVVPALVLFGGMPMHAAIGTSLLIIALKSFAGLAGYLSHVAIDPTIAGAVTAAAITGSLVGAGLSTKARPEILEKAFAWFVLAMGAAMLSQEVGIMAGPLVGGVLIGISASLLLLWIGRIAGISGILAGILHPQAGDVGWRVAFLTGLLVGGVVLAVAVPEALVVTAPGSLALVAVAGVLVGWGTRLGNGCTSGHGVCGISRVSPRSLLATVTFIASGAVTVYLVHHGRGGVP